MDEDKSLDFSFEIAKRNEELSFLGRNISRRS